MKRVLTLILSSYFLSGCDDSSQHQSTLFAKMTEYYQSSQDDISLSSLTAYNWEEVCIFLEPDSSYSLAYASYDALRKKENLTIANTPKNPKNLKRALAIFLFKGEDKSYVEWNKNLYIDQEKNLFLKSEANFSCINSSALLAYKTGQLDNYLFVKQKSDNP